VNAAQIGQYMRRLVDDPGIVRLPYSLQATMLGIAYDEFRNLAPSEVWERAYNSAMVNSAALDLTGILFYSALGVAPTTALASRLTRVCMVDPTTGAVLGTFTPKASWEQLGQSPGSSTIGTVFWYGGQSCWLDGQILRFSYPINGTVQIWYLPTDTIDWLASLQSGAGFVDNLVQWHDIIALLAAEQYYITQAQLNPALESQLRRRTDKMMEFFALSRTGKAGKYVSDDRVG
jgi:hypothetical protein